MSLSLNINFAAVFCTITESFQNERQLNVHLPMFDNDNASDDVIAAARIKVAVADATCRRPQPLNCAICIFMHTTVHRGGRFQDKCKLNFHRKSTLVLKGIEDYA